MAIMCTHIWIILGQQNHVVVKNVLADALVQNQAYHQEIILLQSALDLLSRCQENSFESYVIRTKPLMSPQPQLDVGSYLRLPHFL